MQDVYHPIQSSNASLDAKPPHIKVILTQPAYRDSNKLSCIIIQQITGNVRTMCTLSLIDEFGALTDDFCDVSNSSMMFDGVTFNVWIYNGKLQCAQT